jgi:hypothetical protein
MELRRSGNDSGEPNDELFFPKFEASKTSISLVIDPFDLIV